MRQGVPWYLYSLVAMGCFGGMLLCYKQLLQSGLAPQLLLTVLSAVVLALCVAFNSLTNNWVQISRAQLGVLVFVGLLSFIGNLAELKGVSLAPNPGYAAALVSVNVIVVTLAAVALFDAHLSLSKLFGVLLCIAGAAILAR